MRIYLMIWRTEGNLIEQIDRHRMDGVLDDFLLELMNGYLWPLLGQQPVSVFSTTLSSGQLAPGS